MKCFARFFENVQQDLKTFIYWCLVFTIFRIVFIMVFSGQLNGNYADVPLALFLGLRLSLKTAGILALIGFVLATLPKIIFKAWPAKKIRILWHGLSLVFFSICFMARIPYYKIFNAAFNMMLVNGAHDDIKAIIVTAVEEYQLLWRLPLAIVLAAALIWLLNKALIKTPVMYFDKCKYKPLAAGATIVLIAVLCVFVRYGGAFNYANSINWESAARLKSTLLNEAVLDDGQALYRVRASIKKMAKANNVKISVEELRQKIALTGGKENAATFDEAFVHTVKQPKMQHQPKNVVLIVGESFGQWPFLPKFKDLGLVDNMLALQNSVQAAHINTMLAHGSGTITAVNGLLCGLPDNGIYENYQAISFQEKYTMGIGYIMHKLGYKTVFWYGGFPGWQNLKNFVLAQGFDEFHCADEFGYDGGNAWGCPDELLLRKVGGNMDKEPADKKVFHVVLTTSNHPPYTLDIDKIGFPRAAVRDKLPADISKDDKVLTELGHIWYADKTMGDFVKAAEKNHPDSLFIITGDHSERFDFAIEQDARTRSTIPCIFYGQGVQADWFAKNSVGCHMQLAGTLAELLAPAGFEYNAMMDSMLENNSFAFNHRLFAKEDKLEVLDKLADKQQEEKIAAMRSISAWRMLKGNKM